MINNIFLSASELSIITGDNRYKSLRDYTIQLWKRFNYNNYIIIKNYCDNQKRKAENNKKIKLDVSEELKNNNININISNLNKSDIKKEFKEIEIILKKELAK